MLLLKNCFKIMLVYFETSTLHLMPQRECNGYLCQNEAVRHSFQSEAVTRRTVSEMRLWHTDVYQNDTDTRTTWLHSPVGDGQGRCQRSDKCRGSLGTGHTHARSRRGSVLGAAHDPGRSIRTEVTAHVETPCTEDDGKKANTHTICLQSYTTLTDLYVLVSTYCANSYHV